VNSTSSGRDFGHDQLGFDMQVAKTPTYPVLCPFPLFVAVHDHNPPKLRIEDGLHMLIIDYKPGG